MIQSVFATLLAAILFTACAGPKAAKTQYSSTVNAGGTKVLNGYITRKTIETDSAFTWFATNMKYGTAPAEAITAFQQKKDAFRLLVFGGTWCGDTQNLLPAFYRLIDKSGYPEQKITLVGVDEQKHDKMELYKQWNIVNVPTFIVIDGSGKERGRVVEYGTMGSMEKELGTIVSKL